MARLTTQDGVIYGCVLLADLLFGDDTVISAEIGRTRLPKGHGRKHHEYVHPVVGEHGLWQAVLSRAIRDCFAMEPGVRRKARVWLFSDKYQADREVVCDFAGVNFDCFRNDLLGFVNYMREQKKYQGHSKREVAKYIAKMFMRHGRFGDLTVYD